MNFDDIPAFISVLLGDSFLAEADINQDGVVEFDDVPLFVETLLNWPGLFAMFQGSF